MKILAGKEVATLKEYRQLFRQRHCCFDGRKEYELWLEQREALQAEFHIQFNAADNGELL